MIKNRTSRGTPLRSTRGMRTLKAHSAWILVADQHRLCLFERTKDEMGESLVMRDQFLNPQGRMKGHDMVSDRPGRTFDSQDRTHSGQKGGVRHSYGTDYDPEAGATQALVKEAIALVGKHGMDDSDVTLTVLAEPRLAGTLRPALERAAPKCEVEIVEKDLAWIPREKLEERVASLLETE